MSNNMIQTKKTKTIKQKNKKRRTRKHDSPNTVIKVPMKPTESNEDLSKPLSVSSSLEPTPTPTPKRKPTTNQPTADKSELVKMFLEMLTTIKLYHWNTHSYARHKATDELHEKLSDLVDEFVEVMQGKMFSPNRIRSINEEISAITPETKEKMVDKIVYT